jgi:hypothetical protein
VAERGILLIKAQFADPWGGIERALRSIFQPSNKKLNGNVFSTMRLAGERLKAVRKQLAKPSVTVADSARAQG